MYHLCDTYFYQGRSKNFDSRRRNEESATKFFTTTQKFFFNPRVFFKRRDLNPKLSRHKIFGGNRYVSISYPDFYLLI